jgi:hypothetical protein
MVEVESLCDHAPPVLRMAEDDQARVARERKKRKAKHQKANRTWSSAYKLPVVDSTDEETGDESDGSEKK